MFSKPRMLSRRRVAIVACLLVGGGLAVATQGSADTKGANPLLSLDEDDGRGLVEATVEERLRAGSYSYLRLRSPDGAVRWTAVLGGGEAEGTMVAVTHFGTRRDFRSRRLERTFDRLDFVMVTPIQTEK